MRTRRLILGLLGAVAFGSVIALSGYRMGESAEPPAIDRIKDLVKGPALPPVPGTPIIPPTSIPNTPNGYVPPASPGHYPTVPPLPGKQPDLPPQFPKLPQLPQAEIPTPTPVVIPPVAEIIEPVASVHRFEGAFLGLTGEDIIRYVPMGPETAYVVSGLATAAIPRADQPAAAAEKTRTLIPLGQAVRHNGKVFVLAKRELLALDQKGVVDWRFVLPGKLDAPEGTEELMGFVGFENDVVRVARRFIPRESGPTKLDPTISVFTFSIPSGRLMYSVNLTGKLDTSVTPVVDPALKKIYAVVGGSVHYFDLQTGSHYEQNSTVLLPIAPLKLMTISEGVLAVDMVHGKSMLPDRVHLDFGPGVSTALPAIGDAGRNVFAGFQNPDGKCDVRAFDLKNRSVLWSRPLNRKVTAAPLLTDTSVYVVSGPTLYRLDKKTGSIGWKLTLPIAESEAITELSLNGGEIHASGNGVLVRVWNRPEPAPPAPIPPEVPALTPPVPR